MQVVGTIIVLFALSPQLAPILGVLMLVVSVLVGKHIFPAKIMVAPIMFLMLEFSAFISLCSPFLVLSLTSCLLAFS